MTSHRALIPYVGKPKAPRMPRPRIVGRPEPLARTLGPFGQSEALRLFRAGFDNVDIAKQMQCTPAAAAGALARARDRLVEAGR